MSASAIHEGNKLGTVSFIGLEDLKQNSNIRLFQFPYKSCDYINDSFDTPECINCKFGYM